MKITSTVNGGSALILKILYTAFSIGKRTIGEDELIENQEATREEVFRMLSKLAEAGFATAVTNDSYRITMMGFIYCETDALAEAELIKANQELRVNILGYLAGVHEQYGGSQSPPVQVIADTIKRDDYVIANCMEILKYLGMVEDIGFGYRITNTGLSYLEDRQKREKLIQRFDEISQMESHKRGVELQTLFAAIAKRDGWDADTSVRSENEEIDVFLHRDFKLRFG